MYTFTQPLTRALDTAAGSCAVLCGALPEEILKAAIDLIPMHALGKPGDVAEAVRYLLSDEAHYLTGALIPVAGGLLMM
jgi:NAD(P)-dependent dehydrogenase (short-subunit alcohol dehydrogenase family)